MRISDGLRRYDPAAQELFCFVKSKADGAGGDIGCETLRGRVDSGADVVYLAVQGGSEDRAGPARRGCAGRCADPVYRGVCRYPD
jgi:hypothetical protein